MLEDVEGVDGDFDDEAFPDVGQLGAGRAVRAMLRIVRVQSQSLQRERRKTDKMRDLSDERVCSRI